MNQKYPAIIRRQSQIAYNYATIKITKSRLDKGLLAIPASLIQWFPKQNCQINAFLDDSIHSQLKTYTSYTSRSRECRIGGLAEWFRENQIKEGDEIVLQVIDKDNFVYRLIPELKFITKTNQIQTQFDNSTDELNAEQNLFRIADWTRADEKTAKLTEFFKQKKATDLFLPNNPPPRTEKSPAALCICSPRGNNKNGLSSQNSWRKSPSLVK